MVASSAVRCWTSSRGFKLSMSEMQRRRRGNKQWRVQTRPWKTTRCLAQNPAKLQTQVSQAVNSAEETFCSCEIEKTPHRHWPVSSSNGVKSGKFSTLSLFSTPNGRSLPCMSTKGILMDESQWAETSGEAIRFGLQSETLCSAQAGRQRDCRLSNNLEGANIATGYDVLQTTTPRLQHPSSPYSTTVESTLYHPLMCLARSPESTATFTPWKLPNMHGIQ